MAVSSIPTHTLLNAWQRRMNVPIWHFNQVAGQADGATLAYAGAGVYVQPEREWIAEALVQAIGLAYPFLRYSHVPLYWTETVQLARRYSTMFPLTLKWKHLQAIGKRGAALLDADAAVVYSDMDGDGINDTATITVTGIPATITDTSELQVFYRVADGADGAADERWQIEPMKVSLNAGTAVLTGSRALFTKPASWQSPYRSPNFNQSSKNILAITDAAAFVTAVDVYRIFPDTTDAVVLRSIVPGSTSPYTQSASAEIINGTSSTVLINNLLGYCDVFPVAVTVHYYAGLALVNGMPARQPETSIIRLANAQFPNRPDDWDADQWRVWQDDLRLYPEGSLPENLLSNPFGVRVGEVEAWKQIRTLMYTAHRAGLRHAT